MIPPIAEKIKKQKPFEKNGIIVHLLPLKVELVNTLSYKTVSKKPKEVTKEWVLIDASEIPLGRVASVASIMLRGKNKPYFTPHVDCGDNVIIINAEKVVLTGKKWKQKQYVRYTGYPGGQKFLSAEEVQKKDPKKIIEKAVKGMLPKNKLGSAIYKNLKVFIGENHDHEAQKPKKIDLKELI